MAKNRVYESGDALNMPVIAGTVSGSPVIVGMLPGVALTTRDSNGNASCRFGEGAYRHSVTAAGSVAVGAPIYITSTTYALTDAAGAGKQLYGHALEAKSSGASIIAIRVAPFAVAVDTPA